MSRGVGLLVTLVLLASACDGAGGGTFTPVPVDYPTPVNGTHYELVVNGQSEEDHGSLGAWLVDDALPSKRHYQIDGGDLIVSVPSLAVGTYTEAMPNVSALYSRGGLYSTLGHGCVVNIDGNQGGWLWGRLDGVFDDLTSDAGFEMTGRFSALITRP